MSAPVIHFIRQNYPWLLAGMMMTFTTSFGQTFFISIFADDIMMKFNLTNGEWGGIYALGTTVSGILTIWAGVLSDYFRVRFLAPILMVLLASFALAFAFNPYVAALPFIIFGLRFCGQSMLFHVTMVGMARWFSANRGKAISISGIGFSIGEAFLPLITVSLLIFFKWETIWIIAAFMALLFIPVILFLLRKERNPKDILKTETVSGIGGKHWTRADVLKNWIFWSLIPLIIAPGTFGTALFFQQVHIAKVKQWDLVDYVALFPIYTASVVVAMLIIGVLIDKFAAKRLIPFVQLPMLIGFLILSSASTIPQAAIAFIFLGMMNGFWSTLSINFWAELYGTLHLGAIKATSHAVMVFGSALGPFITGYLIDFGYDFPEQMPFIALYIGCASLLSFITLQRIRLKYT